MVDPGLALGQRRPSQRRSQWRRQWQRRWPGGPRLGRRPAPALFGCARPADRHRAGPRRRCPRQGRRQGGQKCGRLRPDAPVHRQLGRPRSDHQRHPAHPAAAAPTAGPGAQRPPRGPRPAGQLAAWIEPQPRTDRLVAPRRRRLRGWGGSWSWGEERGRCGPADQLGKHQRRHPRRADRLHQRQGRRTRHRGPAPGAGRTRSPGGPGPGPGPRSQ